MLVTGRIKEEIIFKNETAKTKLSQAEWQPALVESTFPKFGPIALLLVSSRGL